ncbi:hypothetical protein BDZ89DRAFT_1065394 [Hymenopellis radicata]|nr:hypothetical protein BDZ89DRAFT_1065394 [Hymenopellis radicata]
MEETKHQSDEMIRNLGIKVDEGKAKIIMLQSDLEAELVVLRESLNKAEQKIRDTKKELQLQNERHQALAQTNTPETHDIQVRYEELRQQFLALQKDHQAMRDEHDLRNMKEHFKISQMRKSLKTILIVSRDDARSLVSAVNMQLSMLEELADGRLSLEVGKWTTGSVDGNTCPDLDVEGEGSARKKRKNMHTGL